MKIAFLGKGGSGKSTMATAMVNFAREHGNKVLAIDVDYNMDLTYNLHIEPRTYLGTDPEYIKEYVTGARSMTYKDTRAYADKNDISFTLSPLDPYTQSIALKVDDSLYIITAGPHTERVRSQEACSHSLSSPLKVYLPRLVLAADEWVIMDERAGTDPVSTGILNAVDLAVIVRENTPNSMRVAEQIRTELERAGIRHIVVENKKDGIERDTKNVFDAIISHIHSSTQK